MRRWELWRAEYSSSFFPEENELCRQMAIAEGEVLTWTVIAKGHNPAMRAYYEHMGWGEYKPELRADGTPYPESEDDDYVAPDDGNVR